MKKAIGFVGGWGVIYVLFSIFVWIAGNALLATILLKTLPVGLIGIFCLVVDALKDVD